MPAGTLLYAQSGGVTAVINATAAAVIETARARGVKVLADLRKPLTGDTERDILFGKSQYARR